MDDRMSDKPLGRLLLEGLGEIAWIAVLVALGVLLPLPLVALGWALLLGAEWAMDRWRGKVPYLRRPRRWTYRCRREVAPGAAKRPSEPPRASRSACSTAARSPWAARWYATT